MNIVRINVKLDIIDYEEITSNSKYFLLGARGLSSQIVHDEVPPRCNPLGRENKLILANGILTGSPFPNSARTSVGGKSPLTNGVKEANVGGRPSLMLAKHGIRALVLEDISSELRIILINENGIKLLPGKEYKGLGNYKLHQRLRVKYGENIGIYSIGPAGEYKMLSATIAANDLEGYPSRHAGRGGLGAVMGAKGIKAIVIIPPKESKVKIHDLKKFRQASTPFAKHLAETKKVFSTFGTALNMRAMSEHQGIPTKNFRFGSFDKISNISGEKLHELVIARGGKKNLACSPYCVIKCSNLIVDENGNHVTSSLEYETMALNGTNLLIDDLDSLAKIDHFCDDVGIDTIEFGGTVGVAMDCGKIPWGDAKVVSNILDKEIRENTEIGKLYGNGVKNIGNKLNAQRIPEIKGQGISAYDPRVFKGMGVTYATSPMGADHTSGAAIVGRVPSQTKDYGELTKNEGKFDLSFELQVYTTVLDSMGCCYFIGPSYENMEIITAAINAMYNLDLTRAEVINIGKHILKIELAFNEKAGITKDMNDVPKFLKLEPSEPSGLKFTFTKEELQDFWKKLE
ncbi:MAG TPA: aldehyde ferredoxin oxidoreductase C-terminal domain-containing protein [Candidatus Nanopelagicaceae bacterium]|nr:aldehyde ferredoxin oxidoreductase C-terminal domain-containing protein [Candidatus Nanopelagicaceae bacterium]